jgi:hypothetical protein
MLIMLDAIKRLWGGATAPEGQESKVLAQWAKEAGLSFKKVSQAPGGVVIVSPQGWRAEWGASQRPYIKGHELRFRFESRVPGDVQALLLTRTLAHVLEADVFDSFTDAMQTRVDNTLPDEMRWLAMHPKVSLQAFPALAKRFLLIANAEPVLLAWLDAELGEALEMAATTWWTDPMPLAVTINRGILTLRSDSRGLSVEQLRKLSALFDLMARKLAG